MGKNSSNDLRLNLHYFHKEASLSSKIELKAIYGNHVYPTLDHCLYLQQNDYWSFQEHTAIICTNANIYDAKRKYVVMVPKLSIHQGESA